MNEDKMDIVERLQFHGRYAVETETRASIRRCEERESAAAAIIHLRSALSATGPLMAVIEDASGRYDSADKDSIVGVALEEFTKILDAKLAYDAQRLADGGEPPKTQDTQ